MTKIVGMFFAAIAISAAAAYEPLSQRPVPQSDDPNGWWQKRFAEKQALVKAGGSEVVFIGDSITQGLDGSEVWEKVFAAEPFKALNLGFSGDRTEHVLWRINHGELDGYKAKAIVLMIGTNNTGHRPYELETPVDTLSGISEVIQRIRERQPQATIVLHPILPRGESPDDPLRKRNDEINESLKQLDGWNNIVVCDFGDRLLDAKGRLIKDLCPDFLHPNDAGRKIWARALVPVLRRILSSNDADTPRAAQAIRRRTPEYIRRMADRRRKLAENKTGEFDVVFLGDSITHGWEGNGREVFKKLNDDYRIFNLGHSGDRTEHLVWRFQNGELEGFKAKLFMLMIGTNNGDDKAEDVAAGIKRIIEIVREKHPESKVLLLPIFPRAENAKNNHRIKNEKTNAIIRGYADGKTVLWLDFNDRFLEPGPDKVLPRSIMPDLLHPNHDGYLVWEAAVRPVFREVCGR